MKRNKFKLNNITSNNINDSYITIEYNNNQPLTKYTKILLHKFLTLLNSHIGANTNLNYHINPVKEFKIQIPIYVYTNDEKKMSSSDLVEKRVNTLINHLENLDWSKHTNLQEQWLIYSLKTVGIDITTDFLISTTTDPTIGFQDLNQQPIKIKAPAIHQAKLKRITYADGSTILYLSTPYLNDYGVFVNLSTTFDEMGMSFNALHLYEHLMTYAWKGIDFSKIKMMNGSTWPHSLCSVFVITGSLESMKTFAASFIKFYLESREAGFWNKPENLEGLKLETQRTISETRTERTLSSLCRSDLHAYDFKYNTNIFEYWSQRPFDMLIAGPDSLEKLFMNKQTIDKFIKLHPSRKVKRPENVIYKTLPLDTIKMKQMKQFRVIAADKQEIRDYMMRPNPNNKSLFGIDSKIVSDNENLDIYNSVLHVLCYNNKMFSEEELQRFTTYSVIPFSCIFFSDTSLSNNFAGDYLFDPIVDNDNMALFQSTATVDDEPITEKQPKGGKKKGK